MSIEERIIELEIQLTHQEDTITDLSDVVFSQQKIIDRLEARLAKIESSGKSDPLSNIKDSSEETPPPHY
jgi:SlyX protein